MTAAVLALLIAAPLAAQDTQAAQQGNDTALLTAPAVLWSDTEMPHVTAPGAPAAETIPLTVPHTIDARLVPAAIGDRSRHVVSNDGAIPQRTARRGRYGAGLIGFGVGALTGIGIAALGGPYKCSCDDPGLEQGLIGFAVGGTLGAGIGAALPASDVAGCSQGARIGRGIAGSVGGMAVSAAALFVPIVGLFAAPFITPLGASLALRSCT